MKAGILAGFLGGALAVLFAPSAPQSKAMGQERAVSPAGPVADSAKEHRVWPGQEPELKVAVLGNQWIRVEVRGIGGDADVTIQGHWMESKIKSRMDQVHRLPQYIRGAIRRFLEPLCDQATGKKRAEGPEETPYWQRRLQEETTREMDEMIRELRESAGPDFDRPDLDMPD